MQLWPAINLSTNQTGCIDHCTITKCDQLNIGSRFGVPVPSLKRKNFPTCRRSLQHGLVGWNRMVNKSTWMCNDFPSFISCHYYICMCCRYLILACSLTYATAKFEAQNSDIDWKDLHLLQLWNTESFGQVSKQIGGLRTVNRYGYIRTKLWSNRTQINQSSRWNW